MSRDQWEWEWKWLDGDKCECECEGGMHKMGLGDVGLGWLR